MYWLRVCLGGEGARERKREFVSEKQDIISVLPNICFTSNQRLLKNALEKEKAFNFCPCLRLIIRLLLRQATLLMDSIKEILLCTMCVIILVLVFFSDVSSQSQGSLAISTAQREKRLLNGIIQNLLPAVGPSVKSVVLAYSSTVSSKMVCSAFFCFFFLNYNHAVPNYTVILILLSSFQVRQILSLCPNITHLDLTQTDITDFAFDR